MTASLILALALVAPDSAPAPGARAVARATATILSGESVDFGDLERPEPGEETGVHPGRYARPAPAAGTPETEFRLIEFQ